MSNTVIVTWTEWLENWTIGRLAEGASADKYLNTLPAERTAFAFDTDAADWLGAQWRERFTCPQLVQIFNTIRDTTVPAVTKFENKDAALRRLTGQMVARARELPEVGAVPPTQEREKMPKEAKVGEFRPLRKNSPIGKLVELALPGLMTVEKLAEATGTTSEKVEAALKALRRTHGIDHRFTEPNERVLLVVPPEAEVFIQPKEKPAREKKETGDRAPVRHIADDATITVLAEKNPKREGTKAYAAFSLYRSGMTCAEFVAAGGSKGDLSWDRSHGFIAISDAA